MDVTCPATNALESIPNPSSNSMGKTYNKNGLISITNIIVTKKLMV